MMLKDGLYARVTTLIHKLLTQLASVSTETYVSILSCDNVQATLQPNTGTDSVHSSEMYSRGSSPAPLIHRLLSVGFASRYLFSSSLFSIN